MTLRIHNTLTRQKEDFKPIDPQNVRVYFCGPTVYNYAHIGNARAAVVFDLLVRVLRHEYGAQHVRYVSNFTDIDDKIIAAAKETGEPISAITEKFGRIYNEDMAALGVNGPDVQPKATEYIPQMIAMVEKLIARKHAYAAEGHVLFDVPSWPDYGQLSRRSRDDLIAGARVDVAPYKKDPADFVLWKPSTPEQPGWDSPWGRGRPGWHLECSAMNEALNGNHFDIHAGGEDLIFPHHENEIAQSVCAHGEPYCNYWMHNGFLMVEGKKMSKSLGNFLLVHDLIKKYPPEALRLALLATHYRQPLDFTNGRIQWATETLNNIYSLLDVMKDVETVDVEIPPMFIKALQDDLNTPEANAQIAQLLNSYSKRNHVELKSELLAIGKLMGLFQQKPDNWMKKNNVSIDGQAEKAIKYRIDARNAARKNKNFALADEIRLELENDGILIEDTPQGTRWKHK